MNIWSKTFPTDTCENSADNRKTREAHKQLIVDTVYSSTNGRGNKNRKIPWATFSQSFPGVFFL